MALIVGNLDFSDAVRYHYGQFPPPNVDHAALLPAVGDARAALGRYDQMLRTLHNSEILLAPLQRQEAVTSSRMEGTISNVDELLRIEADDDMDGATDPLRHRSEAIEVFLYQRALRYAQAAVKEGQPISGWLLRQSHGILLGFGRGAGKGPGEFKTMPNYLYDEVSRRVRFVPIDPETLPAAMSDLDRWIARADVEPTLQAAIAHVEFEALHPFNDGNGRIGRMIIPLMLWRRGLLAAPHLYISQTLESRRDLYVHHMREVSRSGAWTQWCQFFLESLCLQVERNLDISDRIRTLYEDMKGQFREVLASQWTIQALDYMFANPIFRNSRFVERSGIPAPSARRVTKLLVERGLLTTREPASGRRPALYAFEPLMKIVRV